MRILVTNDDGLDAAGLAALFNAAKRLGDPFVVTTPDCRSIMGHGATTKRTIKVDKRQDPRFGTCYICNGTPADSVRLALKHLPVGHVDMVLAGINHGANAGADVHYSGTVAAAREAVLLGTTGIAVSQLIRPDWSDNWTRSTDLAGQALQELLVKLGPAPIPDPPSRSLRAMPASGIGAGSPPHFVNINLPDPQDGHEPRGIKYCPLTLEPLQTSFSAAPPGSPESYETKYTGRYFQRPAPPGFDFHYLMNDWITITPLTIDATDHAKL